MDTINILIKIVLIISSAASFIPQLHRLYTRRDSTGISSLYVLFDLLLATEQLTLGIRLIAIDNVDAIPSIVHDPPTVGDWLNLGQFAVVWVCHLALFILCLCLPPSRAREKIGVSTTCLAFALISLVLVAYEATIPVEEPGETAPRARAIWFYAFFFGIHSMLISPIITLLGFASLYFQARETQSRSDPGALSPVGLGLQAIVFAVVGVWWMFELGVGPWAVVFAPLSWYHLVGWATVDNLIFAFVQWVVLYFVCERIGRRRRMDETAPLLS